MNEIETASGVTPADVGGGNEVAAHFDALGDAADGEFGRGQPEIMDFDAVTECLGTLEGAGVGRAAEGAFEAEGIAGFEATVDFVKKEFACFYGDRLDIEWRKAAGEFIRIEKSRDGIELAEVGAGCMTKKL